MAERGREVQRLGRTLRDEPGSFPDEALGVFRRAIRKVWRARGGGLYACGFLVTFIYLEVTMFFGDIFEAESVSDFFTGQIAEMLFRWFGESIQNTVWAFLWPIPLIQFEPPWGVGIFVALYLLFEKVLKKPIDRWLFQDDDSAL